MTLLITGAVQYSRTVSADADGFVRFEVPLVETNSVVTIELSVQDSSGTVLWYGSDTQQVKDGGNLSISLTRQYWTLTPGSIAVSATSYSLLYNASTWTSDSTELSVTGLENAPAGSTFSYEWKDESGNVIGTDPTLTQSVYQLYGSPAGAGSLPPGDITKTITVTVSYTDASGAAVTADASAEIALGGPVVLPAFSMHAAPPSNPADYDAAHSNPSAATPLFALTSRSAGIVITADAGAAEFPAGTQFTLTINGTAFPAQASPSWTVSLADLGYTDATAPTLALPASLSIMCTAGNTRAQVPETGSGSAIVCLLYTIPDFTVTVSPPTAPSYVAAKSDTTNKKYALADLSGAFSFTPVPAAGTSFPAGTTFEWTVTMGSSSASRPDTTIIASCTASPSLIGLTDATIGRTSGTATAISVTCKAKNDHAADRNASNSGSTLASAFLLQTIPSFTISAEPASYDDDNSPKTGGTITAYALTSATGTIDISAGGATFPAGTTFDWTVNGTSLTGSTQHGSTLNLSPAALGITSANISKSSVSPTEIVIKCKAKNENAAADLDATDFTLKVFLLAIPDVAVTLSTPPAGLNQDPEGTYLVRIADLTTETFGFSASPTSGTMPSGVKYTWTIGTTELNSTPYTEQTISKTLLQMGVVTAPTTQQTLTVKCTVSHDNLAAGTEKYNTVDVKIIGTYSVSFAARGGTPAPATQDVASGGTATEPATAPSKTGATFGGWYTSTDGGATLSATAYDFDTAVTANVTLYAKWLCTDFTGTVADFLGATFAPNELSSAYTVSLTGAVTAAQLTSIAKAIGDSADSNFKGVYISLDLSGASIAENYIPNDTFNASSNADLATYLAGIVLPDTLTCLGHRAFKGCTNLSGSVTIPSTCTVIGQDPFLDTGVTSLSDATPGRTWSRKWTGGGLVPTPNAWSGTLADDDALSRIDADRPDIGDYNYSTP